MRRRHSPVPLPGATPISATIEHPFPTDEGRGRRRQRTRRGTRERGRRRRNRPHGVHRVSAADGPSIGESLPTSALGLDVVVAAGRIPQDVVVLGLDYGRAAGVHSVGRPGPREDPETSRKSRGDDALGVANRLVGGNSPEHSQLSSSPLHRQLGRPDATHRGGRRVQRKSGGKVGGRREVGRPPNARTRGDHLFEQ